MFWAVFAAWLVGWAYMYLEGTTNSACILGVLAAWLGAYGHNWAHQPNYRNWAYLSLDTAWMSSEDWYRQHVLQHHMYTQTPWDNHLHGSDPFIPTNPTRERSFLEQYVFPLLLPLFLTFGPWANWLDVTKLMVKGQEPFEGGRLVLPLQLALML